MVAAGRRASAASRSKELLAAANFVVPSRATALSTGENRYQRWLGVLFQPKPRFAEREAITRMRDGGHCIAVREALE
jgi:hypothetical protein